MLEQENNWQIGKTSAPLPPLVKGLSLMGNLLDFGNQLPYFLVKSYQEYGPIFRIKLLHRPYTVMAGLDANRFTAKHDEEVFTNEFTFAGLIKEFGSFLASDPPAEHKHLRSLMKNYYSSNLAIDRISDLIQVVDDLVDSLKIGDSFEVYPTIQELVVTQLGLVMHNYHPGDYVKDVKIFGSKAMNVHMFFTHPSWILKFPSYKRAKARAYELAQKTLNYLKQTVPGQARPFNVIDKLMESTDINGKPFTDEYLHGVIIRNHVGGLNTTTALISMIFYIIHKHEDFRDRITQEVTKGFTQGVPTFKELRQFKLLNKAILETTRLYPIAYLIYRNSVHPFEFGGYRVDAGTRLIIATTVPRYLPEYYPNPWEFDMDREYRTPQTLAHYGLGNYTCLGNKISDVLVMVTMAALMRRGKFALEPADYEMCPKKTHTAKIRDSHIKLKLMEKYD